MGRIEFGKPKNSEQALLRFPGQRHPLMDKDRQVMDLVFLRDIISDCERYDKLPLFKRVLRTDPETPGFMRAITFVPDVENPLHITSWGYLGENNPWAEALDVKKKDFRWWKISNFSPTLHIDGLQMILIQSKKMFLKQQERYRDYANSELWIGVVRSEEADCLIEDLGCNED